jgi:fervidolysin-like protein/putative zinc finger protein
VNERPQSDDDFQLDEWLRSGLASLLDVPVPPRLLEVASGPGAHQRADLLLPWFANGTLNGDDLDFVTNHVDACPRCRREVDWLRKLADVCAEARQRGDPLVAARSPAPEGARIATAPSRPLPPRATPSNRNGTWARWAIAAQFAVIIVLGAALMPLHDGPAQYRTLGSTAAQADAGSIVVVFDPGITEAELRRIVRIAGARVIDGPTQADAYVLSLAPERVGAALAMLQSQRAVLFAAPLGGTPQR